MLPGNCAKETVMQPSPRLESIPSQTQAAQPSTEITIKLTPFDRKEYRALIEARDQTLRRIVKRLKPALGLSNAVDAGCGVGFFSQTLAECGLCTCGFDARAQNIEEARRRFPGIPFEQADVEAREISQLGRFDLVLCFGLLYHLENPLQAIRNLRAITDKCLVLESMCLPEDRCSLLLRQELRQDDQSLTEMSCYSSESSLIKMLSRSGFAKVYRVTPLPDHDDFRETREHAQRRTVLVASCAPIDVAGFRLVLESQETEDPWAKNLPTSKALPQRIRRFLASSPRSKYITLAMRARRIFPDHDDFRETREHAQRRTVLVASCAPIDVAGFRLVLESQETEDPWAKNLPTSKALPQRIRRFLASSPRSKYITLAMRARRIF